MIRWAKLPPALDAAAAGGYLTLAAAFHGRLLVDEGLPEQLRDIAAALASRSQIEREAVSQDELQALPLGDVSVLLDHLGRRLQDEPGVQFAAVNAIITLARLHPAVQQEALVALARLRATDVNASTVMLFRCRWHSAMIGPSPWIITWFPASCCHPPATRWRWVSA